MIQVPANALSNSRSVVQGHFTIAQCKFDRVQEVLQCYKYTTQLIIIFRTFKNAHLNASTRYSYRGSFDISYSYSLRLTHSH